MSQHIFVLGLDDFNAKELESLKAHDRYKDCEFHALLTYDDLKQTSGGAGFVELMDQARKMLDDFPEEISGIMTFWDFPALPMVSILCEEYDLPHTPVTQIEQCEHKYWARKLQHQFCAQHTPAFELVDPFKDPANIDIAYPYWLKPVNSFSSYLAFYVSNDQEREEAIKEIREGIGAISKPYDEFMALVKDRFPEEMRDITGKYCLAEEAIEGEIYTLAGYAWDGDIALHGIVDTITEKHSYSNARYQYPSHLPQEVQEEMEEGCRSLLTQLPLTHGTFNMEYFYTPEGKIQVLEVNPRLSQSHSEIFREVDGMSHLGVAVDLALGREPYMPHRKGEHDIAAKFYLRHHEDAYVEGVPTKADIDQVKKIIPDLRVKVQVHEGQHLSDYKLHDSYSYELAQFFLGEKDEDALIDAYHTCVKHLPFKLSETRESMKDALREKYQPHIMANE